MSAAYGELLRSEGPCVFLESTFAPSPRARLSLLARWDEREYEETLHKAEARRLAAEAAC